MWKDTIDKRLTKWQEFRNKLNSMEFGDALEKTAELWRTVPCRSFYLDPSEPDTWPDPWELLVDNYYCDVAKCLGIIYTIYFTNHSDKLDLAVRVYENSDPRGLHTVVWINDGDYILNWTDGEIVNKKQLNENKIRLLYHYNTNDLVLHQY